jgi:hypothetical protein
MQGLDVLVSARARVRLRAYWGRTTAGITTLDGLPTVRYICVQLDLPGRVPVSVFSGCVRCFRGFMGFLPVTWNPPVDGSTHQ